MSTAANPQHLTLLDEMAEIGMALVRTLADRADAHAIRDFEIVSRAVRRTILLAHLLRTDQLPQSKPHRDPAPTGERSAANAGSSDRTRLDSIDTLDDISGPFQHVVASIIRDIQTVLRNTPVPDDQADLVRQIVDRQLPLVPNHEADAADLK